MQKEEIRNLLQKTCSQNLQTMDFEGEEEQNEVIEDDIDAIIEKSRKKASSKNDEKMSKGFFGKFFKK